MQAVTIGGVLALHLAALWLLGGTSLTGASRDDHSAAAPARITLRLIAPPPRTTVPPVATRAPASARAAVAPNRARTPPRAPIVSSAPAAITEPLHEAALHAEPPASAREATGQLLDTEASRRAIRASARAPSLGAQLANAREEPDPVGAHQRLANGVRSAGKGDCMKGEFAGAGMGLLSLPFLAVAAASGSCAK